MHLSYRPSIQPSVCTCDRSRNKHYRNNSRRRWFKKTLLLALFLFVFYKLTRPPAPRLTMTHQEWDHYIENFPYEAPTSTAVRSPCPFLNTFANHGILPRSGKNVTYVQYYKAMTVVGVTHEAAVAFLSPVFRIYKEIDPAHSVWSDLRPATHISLNQLGQHNLVEHDISLTRADISEQPDFSLPNLERIQSMVALSSRSNTSLVARTGTAPHLNVRHLGDFRRIKWNEAMQKPLAGYHFGGFYQVSEKKKGHKS